MVTNKKLPVEMPVNLAPIHSGKKLKLKITTLDFSGGAYSGARLLTVLEQKIEHNKKLMERLERL